MPHTSKKSYFIWQVVIKCNKKIFFCLDGGSVVLVFRYGRSCWCWYLVHYSWQLWQIVTSSKYLPKLPKVVFKFKYHPWHTKISTDRNSLSKKPKKFPPFCGSFYVPGPPFFKKCFWKVKMIFKIIQVLAL